MRFILAVLIFISLPIYAEDDLTIATWNIPGSSDLRAEADKIADRVHQIFLFFIDFSGEFIWRYCKS